MLGGVLKCRKKAFHIRWDWSMTFHLRPHLHASSHNRRGLQGDRAEIIVKILSPPTVQRVACSPNARPTIPPLARPPEVAAALISEKHVGRVVQPLQPALKPARARCERCQIRVVHHGHQKIDVFRVGLVGHDRPDHRNSPYGWNRAGCADEPRRFIEEPFTNCGFTHFRESLS